MDIRFSGSRSETAPLTWGQRAIWDTIRKTAPDDHYFNFGRVLAVPRRARPLTVAGAAEVLRALVERHESLRTRLGEAPRGRTVHAGSEDGAEPWQVLSTGGSVPVTVSEGDPERLRDALAETAFDYGNEWPLRIGLVVDRDEVTHIVLVFCHLAADGLGAEVAVTDLRLLLLRGSVPGPPPPSPLELARWQGSEQGLKVAAVAAEHWASEYRRIPPTMFDRRAGVPSDPPIWRALLVSRAMDLAVRRIAALSGASTSTVLLTAASVLAGRVTGHDLSAMLPIVGNRFRGDTVNAVTTLSQEGLFVLDLREGGFTELLRAAKPAALRAYRSAYHDPGDRDRLTERAGRERGALIHPYCCFNDMRFADRVDASPDEASVRRALEETTLTWPLSQERLNCRFCLHVTGEPGGLGVSLTADTGYLPRPAMERYLLDLESLLVEAAFREVLEPVG
ncbi:condensation domain-containing protein [Streptosporangium sp. NPDC048865]|uniref:condensation domain-containing protein n=1 Tax=Streptosporangium sp. NPDC048865 TaxID=3155766 RepID=UPI00341DDB14